MPTPGTDQISEAIKNLSKKKHVLTQGAVQAKQNYDDFKEEIESHTDVGGQFKKNILILDDFSDNIKILVNLFKEAHFDEFLYFLANPGRLLVMNFFVGLVRGLGFSLGFIFLIALITYLIKLSYPSETLMHFLRLIGA